MDLGSRITMAARNQSSGGGYHGGGGKRGNRESDQDMDMDDDSARRGRGGRGGGRGGGKRGRGGVHGGGHGGGHFGHSGTNNSDFVDVEISNWTNGSQDDLVAFIFRKCHVHIDRATFSGTQAFITLPRHEADAVIKLSGIRFAGSKLFMKQSTDSNMGGASFRSGGAAGTMTSNNTIDLLRQFLQSRYNATVKLLDLSNMAHDPLLMQLGVFQQSSDTQSKFFPALMKLAAQELHLDIESVSLAGNGFESLQSITTLAQYFPHLLNISLANNNLRRFRDLDAWAHRSKFPNLRELVLANNPLRDDTVARGPAGEEEYVAEIRKRFVSLQMLDGVVIPQTTTIAGGISFGVEKEVTGGGAAKPERTALPEPIRAPFYDSEQTHATAMQICAQLLPLFDTDRAAMVKFYAPTACFSFAIDTSSPTRTARHNTPFHAMSASRNMSKITTLEARTTRLSVGHTQILRAFNAFPATRHDFSKAQDFHVEAWASTHVLDLPLLHVCVHGCYTEVEGGAVRGFDRVLMVVARPEGPAVISDSMIVHQFYGNQVWDVAKPENNAPSSTTAVAADEQRHAMVQMLQNHTHLNSHYATMCLQQNDWNMERAIANFNELKMQGGIPPEAFA